MAGGLENWTEYMADALLEFGQLTGEQMIDRCCAEYALFTLFIERNQEWLEENYPEPNVISVQRRFMEWRRDVYFQMHPLES